MNKKKVAFICVHNSSRSQIAEALGKHLVSIRRDVFTQNPHAVNLYKKRGYHNCPTVGAVHSVLLLFNRFWGYTGLIHAQPVEESICMIFSLFLLFTRLNEVSEKNQ